MKTVALTGTIGSGKSTVMQYLQKQYQTINTDEIAHALLEKDKAGYLVAIKLFSETILNKDKSINKKMIARYIFSNSSLKEQYETAIHPLILEEVQNKLLYLQEEEFVFIEVPLLFEVNWQKHFDYSVVVVSKEEDIIERLINSRNMDIVDILSRLKQQMTVEEKTAKADFIINNQKDVSDLQAEIEKCLRKLREIAL